MTTRPPGSRIGDPAASRRSPLGALLAASEVDLHDARSVRISTFFFAAASGITVKCARRLAFTSQRSVRNSRNSGIAPNATRPD